MSRIQNQRAEGRAVNHRSFNQFRHRDLAADVTSAGALDPAWHRYAVPTVRITWARSLDKRESPGHFNELTLKHMFRRN